MTLHCYFEPERRFKSRLIMGSFSNGAGGVPILGGGYLDAEDHAVLGMRWTACRVIPEATRLGRGHWHIDNGWILPGRGSGEGFYRVTRNGPGPAQSLRAPVPSRRTLAPATAPWRASGGHIVAALPGPYFGQPWGLDMEKWRRGLEKRIRQHTDRPLIVRSKEDQRPIAEDLRGAWALVTHSSNAAVDAVLAGVPAIVEPTAPTAPLGNVGLHWIERPELRDREPWIASLMCQQFTPDEMRRGLAWAVLSAVHG